LRRGLALREPHREHCRPYDLGRVYKKKRNDEVEAAVIGTTSNFDYLILKATMKLSRPNIAPAKIPYCKPVVRLTFANVVA
jgi:hypothetical protein